MNSPSPGSPPSDMHSTASNSRFVETPFVRKKRRNEAIARLFFGLMAASMVIPLLMILGYIVVHGAPAISWEFLTQNPRGGGSNWLSARHANVLSPTFLPAHLA